MKLNSVMCLLFVVLTLVACTSKDFIKPSQANIDAYIQANPDLQELDKSCIYDGRFEIGIKQATLVFLLGEPKKREIVQQPWAVQEKWIYKKGGQKIFIIEENHVVGILEQN